jgi:hypothetical protein
MYDLDSIQHHKSIDEIGSLLATQTGNKDPVFFQMVVAYFLGKITSSMRTQIRTQIMGDIPINIYTVALATSGFGKGTCVKIIEKNFLSGFRNRFLKETYPTIAEKNLYELAVETAILKKTQDEVEFKILKKEFARLGPKSFTFDSGTVPAVKQARDKDLLAKCGSINLQIDEIGSNLSRELELLHCFLELYDGEIKQKLVKNTNENQRTQDIVGLTPANVLLFGTPNSLFNGSSTEREFFSLLETGYARRSLFAYGVKERVQKTLTAQQIYHRLSNPTNKNITSNWKQHFTHLADPLKYNLFIELLEPEAVELINYQVYCEDRADNITEFDSIKKAEMANRHFKALKLAGCFAFIDEDQFIRMEHILSAIKLVEESGKSFSIMLDREPVFATLARYISSQSTPITHAHLHEKLPFYKESSTKRKELISLATSWGHDNNIIIKSEFKDGVELFSGESLQETSLDKLLVTVSNHQAYNFEEYFLTFQQLSSLGSQSDLHWCNHNFDKQHRCELNVASGFNVLVLDVDGDASLSIVHEILKDYKHIIYTTKRHTVNENRFRIILPMKYILHLDKNDYKLFVSNIIEWLPFNSDYGATERSRKWLSHEADELIVYGEHDPKVELFNPIQFIPKTSKNTMMKEEVSKLGSLNNLEQWFALKMQSEGNRNNNFIKYAYVLKDSGYTFTQIENSVLEFNKKLPSPLTESELRHTVLKSIASKL